MPYAMIALNSIKQNSGLDLPCYVFCVAETGANHHSIDNRTKELELFYDKLIFHKIDSELYAKNNKGWPHYWSHEIFNIRGYEEVIYFDVDIICLGSLKDLPEVDLGMVWEAARNQFYAGFMVVGKKYLNDKTYGEIMKFQAPPNTWGRDQGTYNEYFKKSEITELNPRYNQITQTGFDLIDVRILHYIFKPTQEGSDKRIDPKQYKLWYDHLNGVNAKLKEAGLA
jgi:lipopolysaccharide biosynthesis glycosyltransferase